VAFSLAPELCYAVSPTFVTPDFGLSHGVGVKIWRMAMQRNESPANARNVAAQLDDFRCQSAAVRVFQQTTHRKTWSQKSQLFSSNMQKN
jgi:hypothetical protein